MAITQFFLEPKGNAAHSNDVIAQNLKLSDADLVEIKDEAGTTHRVWPCTLAQAGDLWRSRDTLRISLELWGRNRNYGPIEYKTFLLRH